MGTIRVEAVPVQSYGLGLLRFDHLQLVYQDETDFIDSQDYWYVIEGIQDGALFAATLGASGENGRLSLSVANGASRDELITKIGTPEMRGSRIIKSGFDVLTVWDVMARYAGQIEDQQFPYIGFSFPFGPTPTINSTSLVASALWSVGVDLNFLMPFNLRLSPGPETILGTSFADDIKAQGNFTTVATGIGADTLRGSANILWVEKFYGGAGDDVVMWSEGNNVVNGGQPRMLYATDGSDAVDYSGAGAVHIVANEHAVENKVADYVATFNGGTDQLFSIETLKWDGISDSITAGPGVRLLEKPVELDLNGSSGGRGDELGMSDGDTPLLVNVVSNTMISVQAEANEGLDAGYWATSVEWFTGSTGDDRIYAGSSLIGVDGAGGDDILDARLVAAFTGASPLGYDIELDGGDGDDTIVSGDGRTFARGGSGADTFVLSAMTSGNGTVEFIIDEADSSDKLFIPYDMFKIERGGFEGSTLFQLTGAAFKIDEVIDPSYFDWGLPDDDQVQGNIEFVGGVSYERDGNDLIIRITQGHVETETVDYGPGEPPGPTYVLSVGESDTETIVRVKDWNDGVLGLTFPLTWSDAVFVDAGSFDDYPGYQDAINAATSPDKFIAALEDRPESHLPKEIGPGVVTAARFAAQPLSDGTDGDDILIAPSGGPYQISGLAGDDIITGSDGGDVIDGSTGADTMDGGRGNDVYFIDNANDAVMEGDRGGFDKVVATIDYQLGEFVEHVTLEGPAISATGNALRNTLIGNTADNTLSGAGGDDTLAGNGGDDTLVGGDGSDAYVWELGDGHDTIIEAGDRAADQDLIILAGDLKAEDITFTRNPDALLDLVLRFTDGGSLTVQNYFAAAGGTIEKIEFTSSGALSSTELTALAAAAITTRNSSPVARDDVYAFEGGTSVTIPFAALLENDSDADGDALTISGLTNIQGGTAILDGQGNVVVTRTGDSGSNVSFDYTISDGNGGTSHAHFDVAMNSNTAPVISSGILAAIQQGAPSAGQLVATDADGDTLMYAIKSGARPAKGVIAFQDDGNFTYTPDANATGSDSFVLTASDGFSVPVERRFDVALTALNTAPIANADSGFTLKSGATLTLAASALLANDRDADGHTMTVASVSAIQGGSPILLADGSISFMSASSFIGPASFRYTISDGNGGTSSAIVTLTVESNAPPPGTDTGVAPHISPSFIVGSAPLLNNDQGFHAHSLAIAPVTAGNGGSAFDAAAAGHSSLATFAYESSDGIAGHDTFMFRPSDGFEQIGNFQTGAGLRGAGHRYSRPARHQPGDRQRPVDCARRWRTCRFGPGRFEPGTFEQRRSQRIAL